MDTKNLNELKQNIQAGQQILDNIAPDGQASEIVSQQDQQQENASIVEQIQNTSETINNTIEDTTNVIKEDNNQKVEIANKIINEMENEAENKKHIFSNFDEADDTDFKIKVIGVGGAGCNVIDYISNNCQNIKEKARLYAFNTDKNSLKKCCHVENRFLLNKDDLKGYGSGGDPEIGKQAMIHDATLIKEEIKNTDILFIVAGMGKGTGSGGSSELAKIAKDLGILTVSIINMPSLKAEGQDVYSNACVNLDILSKNCDSITTISNEKIIGDNSNKISFYAAYEQADKEISNIIARIIEIIYIPSKMNIDFADIRNFFINNKYFLMASTSLDSGISQEELQQKIEDSINESKSDIDYKHSNKAIANILMSEETPSDFIKDLRASLSNIVENDNLTLTHGLDYHDDKQNKTVEITYMISGKIKSDFCFDSEAIAQTQKIEAENKTKKISDTEKVLKSFATKKINPDSLDIG